MKTGPQARLIVFGLARGSRENHGSVLCGWVVCSSFNVIPRQNYNDLAIQ